jgi:uncharacterized protein (TIGR00106 family)
MVIAEVSVVPIGTGEPGISRFVAECQRALEKSGVRHTLTPMGTVIEGTLDEVFEAVRTLHQLPFFLGALRVSTHVTLDERRDREATAEGKLEAVRRRLAGE